MNLSRSSLRALRRYYLRLWLYNLAMAAYYTVGAQFWRGIHAVLCGVEWVLVRKNELRARWSERLDR